MPDDEQLSQQQLEAAIWYVKHKEFLRKILFGAIIALDVAAMSYALFGAGNYVVSLPLRRAQELALLRISIPQSNQGAARPTELQFGGVELLQTGQVTDVLARVRNSNSQWYARFSYTIGVGDHTEQSQGFLLPGEERPFYRSFRNVAGGTVVFNLEKIIWKRVSPRETPDFMQFKTDHLNFDIKNVQFFPSVIEGQGRVSRATFSIANKTAYGYIEPKFLVLLYRGTRLIGIQTVVLERFESGQSRDVTLSWFDGTGAVSNVEVLPEIDILNSEVYIK